MTPLPRASARLYPALLAAPREAQAEGAGLWAGGVPPELPTSLHSAGEEGQGRKK